MDQNTSYKQFFDINEIVDVILAYLPGFDKEHFIKAFNFAEEAHRGQMRKDGRTPYIAHPVEVVRILAGMHADEDTLISALLHDVPEDTEKTIKDVKNNFGEKIAFLVEGVTKLSDVHYQSNMPERQIESLKKLLIHSIEDIRVILIKLSDRLHNMRTLDNIPQIEKRLRIAKETLEIYVQIANLLGLRDLKSQLEDLCFKYIHKVDYETITKKLLEGEKNSKAQLGKFITDAKNLFKNAGLKVSIMSRHKNLYSTYKKIHHLGKSIEDFEHRIGIKILVDTKEQCYQALGILHLNFVPKTDRFKDYIANPKSNSYQSLHTTVFGSAGVLTEIQIRTPEMDLQAEYGVASVFFTGKDGKDNANKFKFSSWIEKISELNKGKSTRDFIDNLKLDVFQDRIFVFTPKGMAIDLPKGACVLDLAYAIHSDIGNHAERAEVNGNSKPINAILKNRDVVKIETSKNVTPQLSWLSFVKTNLAKNNILAFQKKISKEKKLSYGHEILQKEFDIAGLGLCEDMNSKKLRQTVEKQTGQKFKSTYELFIAIGEGSINANDVVQGIGKVYKHAKNFRQEEDDGNIRDKIRISLKIVAKNRFGLLRDIAEVLYRNVLDMNSLKGWASKYQADAYFTTEILVDDLKSISKIFNELENIDGVLYVYRMSRRGTIILYSMTTLSAIVWLSHGAILKWFSSVIQDRYLLDLLTYSFVIVMIALVISTTEAINKYFPTIRNKKLLWLFRFSVPLIALLVLAIDLIYFKLNLSWTIIIIELGFIYAYLYLQYKQFLKFKEKT